VFDAAVEAITHTDAAVGTIYKACQDAGYILLITADHGNAEQMINLDTGAPHTAHTTNKVPFIIAGPKKNAKIMFTDDKDRKEGEEEGALSDVAPTVLALFGLEQPEGAFQLFPLLAASRNEHPRLIFAAYRNDWAVATRFIRGLWWAWIL
jgi:2,3-bisphosphoglycerate-independent phosphoglycerate mutase